MADVLTTLAQHIIGPAHVGFIVHDLQRSVAEACRVYGIEQAAVRYEPPEGTDAPTHFAFFRVGELEFEYIEPRDEHFRNVLHNMPSGSGGINHMAWRVQDIDGAMTLLAEAGILPGHVTPDGVISFTGRKMVYLDPATTGGLVIELIEYLAE